jgi:hypothetical protein
MLYAVLVTLPRVGCGTFDAAWDVCVRHGVTAWLQAAFSDAFNVQSTKATAAPTAAVRLHTHTHMPITYCRAHANAYTRPRTPPARAHTHACAPARAQVPTMVIVSPKKLRYAEMVGRFEEDAVRTR